MKYSKYAKESLTKWSLCNDCRTSAAWKTAAQTCDLWPRARSSDAAPRVVARRTRTRKAAWPRRRWRCWWSWWSVFRRRCRGRRFRRPCLWVDCGGKTTTTMPTCAAADRPPVWRLRLQQLLLLSPTGCGRLYVRDSVSSGPRTDRHCAVSNRLTL